MAAKKNAPEKGSVSDEGVKKGASKATGKAQPKKAVAKKPRSANQKAKDFRENPASDDASCALNEAIEPEQVEDPLCGLTEREALFIDIYLSTYIVGQSYIDAGFTVKNMATACAAGSRLLHGVKARAYRNKRIKEMMSRNEDAQDRLLALYVDVAYADARELSEVHVDACRFCYGENHGYQFTPHEFERYRDDFERKRLEAIEEGMPEPEFDPKGGVGFNPHLGPNEDCPECFGRGVERTIFKDTRNLTPAAVSLYAGAKVTKDGMEIKAHSQEKARETLAKIVKLYDDGTTINVNVDPADLEARFAEKMRLAHERMQQVRKDREASQEEGD